MNMYFLVIFFPSDKYLEMTLLNHMVVLFLVYLKTSMLFFQFKFPPTVHEGGLFPISLPTFVISCLLDNSHLSRWEVILHCHFDLHLSGGYWASQVALMVKNSLATAGDIRDPGSIPGSGRSPWGGNDNDAEHLFIGKWLFRCSTHFLIRCVLILFFAVDLYESNILTHTYMRQIYSIKFGFME